MTLQFTDVSTVVQDPFEGKAHAIRADATGFEALPKCSHRRIGLFLKVPPNAGKVEQNIDPQAFEKCSTADPAEL